MRRPAPVLDEGERVDAVFPGLLATVTLTDRRIFVARNFGRIRSIPYEDVKRVNGGWFAGAHDLRDNSDVLYGIYIEERNGREEWAWLGEPKRCATLIRERAGEGEVSDT